MRVMVFGATGVIGRRLLPLLIADGNEIIGVTRRSARTAELRALGAEAVVADALDAAGVQRLVAAVTPDAIVHQLTDLTSHDFAANARLRTVATRHIIDAAKTNGVHRVVAQSIAWTYLPGVDEADEESPVDRSYPVCSSWKTPCSSWRTESCCVTGSCTDPGRGTRVTARTHGPRTMGRLPRPHHRAPSSTWTTPRPQRERLCPGRAECSTSSMTSPRPRTNGCRCSRVSSALPNLTGFSRSLPVGLSATRERKPSGGRLFIHRGGRASPSCERNRTGSAQGTDACGKVKEQVMCRARKR